MNDATMLSVCLGRDNSVKLDCSTLHHLPCKVLHDGPALVKDYFLISPSTTPNSERAASFRGRQLEGHVYKIPSGYRGVIVEPDASFGTLATDADVKHYRLANEFEEFTVWGYDEPRSKENDPLHVIGDYIELQHIVNATEV